MSETLIGRYRLLAELGRGGMSDVYLAASTGLGGFQKLVVIKVSRVSDDPAFAQMFLDEARLSARLSHSNIVQTYEVGEENDRQYIVMEYLDGPSLYMLNRLSAVKGGVPIRMVVQILSGVLTGLHYAHTLKDFDGTALNVVHRDVSPQNVIVTGQGECKLLDFGIAKTSDSRTMTHAGFYRGKLNYMSPEQALGLPVDARADIFSVGVLLAEAITRKPFWGDATTAVISARLLSGEIPDIEEARIEPFLEEICKGALIGARDHRTSSAREFKEALDLYLGTVGGPVSPEELAAFVGPLVASDKARFNAMIDQQLNQNAPPLPVSVRGPPTSSGSSASHAVLTPSGGQYRSRGSGFTPISSTASIAAASIGAARLPSMGTAPVASAPIPSAPVASAPRNAASDLPPSDLPPSVLAPEGPTQPGGSAPPPRVSQPDRGVRTAARKPDRDSASSNLRIIVGAVGAAFLVMVGLVVWLVLRQTPQAAVPQPTPVVDSQPPTTPPAPVTKVAGRIEITVEPASAVLELDDERVANPFISTELDGKTHRLTARAPGFESLTREVSFEQSLTMNLALKATGQEPTTPRPEVTPPSPVRPPPVAVIRRWPPPPPARPQPKPNIATKPEPASQPEAPTVIQELQPKEPPRPKPNTGKHSIDTEVFDDKKQEIDRNAPWEN